MIVLFLFAFFISVQSKSIEYDENLDNISPGRDLKIGKFEMEDFKSGQNSIRVPRGVVWDEDLRWPSPKIPYVISSEMSDDAVETIESTFRYLEQRTCLKFKKRTKIDPDYIYFQNGDGCSSTVGRIGGRQMITLEEPDCILKRTVVHEIMHALGFKHEHQRLDRDKYIKVNWENLKDGFKQDFEKVDTDNMGIPYDIFSVMHYSSDGASMNGYPVMVSKKKGIEVPSSRDRRVSPLDIKKINMLFKCESS